MTRFSAWSYIVEPVDMWQRRIDRVHFDDAPLIQQRDGASEFLCPGDPALRIALDTIPWARDPGSSADPFVRIPRLVQDGINAELIVPTFSWALLNLEEKLRSACLRAYNSWIWNVTTASPRRFYAAAVLPPGAEAIVELQRIASLGLKAAIAPVETAGTIADLAKAATSAGLPLILVRPNGPTPFADFSGFSAACADLTRQAIECGAAAKFLIPGTPDPHAPANVRYVAPERSALEAAPQFAFWGRFGGLAPLSPGQTVIDEAAAGYFKISL